MNGQFLEGVCSLLPVEFFSHRARCRIRDYNRNMLFIRFVWDIDNILLTFKPFYEFLDTSISKTRKKVVFLLISNRFLLTQLLKHMICNIYLAFLRFGRPMTDPITRRFSNVPPKIVHSY